ncbi:MAG: hypothetical protein ACOYL8_04575 [Patescibacteria group bacterium]
MEKNQKLNQEIIEKLVFLYREIAETNQIEQEINELVKNNRPEETGLITEKYATFFGRWRDTGKQVGGQLALARDSSTIFEADINATAICRTIFEKRYRVNPIGKRYSKLRVYYQATDNGLPKGRPAYSWLYPNFGMLLICALSYNGRIFKFEIAKTAKGCDKTWTCEIIPDEAKILNKSRSYLFMQSQELKFCSSEKFSEVLNICETITERVNVELGKAGLEKFLSNVEISEK